MNSCLYRAKVMHHRLEPKQHRFHYNVFMFYLDLDEIDSISKKISLVSRNKFNVFNFRDKDHLQLPIEDPDASKNTKQHILDYLKTNGVELQNPRIMLMTNLCTFGYQFNPVSFYFVFDTSPPDPLSQRRGGRGPGGIGGEAICAVAEISNTYREMKLFFLGKEHFDGNKFHLNAKKYFYVSPFIEHDANFDFTLEVPGEKLNIRIDDYKEARKIFISTLTGTRKELTDSRLFLYALRFPLITLQVIGLIHWNAFLLWMKGLRYFRKKEFPELQREVMREYQD